jgi:type I restriction enzyme S subunit
MTSSTKEIALGEVCEIKQGRYLAPSDMESSPTIKNSVPVVGGNGVLGYTNETTFKFSVPLVTCRGSKCGLMQWAESPTWISNNAMAVYFKEGEGDNFFLHQYLLQTSFEDVTTGSAQPQITITNLSQKRLQLPDVTTQRVISRIMKAIQEKIQTNKRLAKTLEDIAQTIFKSWFIDFDPVRAKMAGEKPAGMDDATAELFPDSMEESELGEIPAGWKVGDLGELCHLTMGQSPPGDAYNLSGEGLPFYQGRTDFGMRFPKTRMYSTLGNRKASPGDVLVSVRAPVGDLNQALEECVIGRGVAAVIHRSGSQAYSYSLMQSIQHRLEYFNGEGTVFGAINKTDFSSIPLVEPPVELLNRFDELASPVNGLLRSLHEQSQNLAATRDALLPRLISGELEVPEDLLVS